MYHGLKLYLIHVTGTRIIEKFTDGLSHGNILKGILSGVKMPKFLPIHEIELYQEPLLIYWICTWTSYPELEPLIEKE